MLINYRSTEPGAVAMGGIRMVVIEVRRKPMSVMLQWNQESLIAMAGLRKQQPEIISWFKNTPAAHLINLLS